MNATSSVTVLGFLNEILDHVLFSLAYYENLWRRPFDFTKFEYDYKKIKTCSHCATTNIILVFARSFLYCMATKRNAF